MEMKDLVQHAERNGMTVKMIDRNRRIVEIGGSLYLYLKSEPLVFNEDMRLIVSGSEESDAKHFKADYIFDFGGDYYWVSRMSQHVEFNTLRYIGQINESYKPDFAHLGIHGGYEIYNGTGDYTVWVDKAKFMGHKALGICERHTLAGAVAFQLACADSGIKPIIGMSVDVKNGDEIVSCKLYAATREGWKNLLRVHKYLNVDTEGEPMDFDQLSVVLAGVVFVFGYGTKLSKDLLASVEDAAAVYYQLDTVVYHDPAYELSLLSNTKDYLDNHFDAIPPILINDSYYLDPDYGHMKHRLNKLSGEFHRRIYKADYKSCERSLMLMSELFREEDFDYLSDLVEVAISNTIMLSGLIEFEIPMGVLRLPSFDSSKIDDPHYAMREWKSNEELFWQILGDGFISRLGDVSTEVLEMYESAVDKEVDVIKRGGFIDYFLILWDVIAWSRRNGIYTGIGRGSAGGSLVAYLMGITHLNPMDYGLLFERFLNESRIKKSLPDIDCDFEGNRRDEVKRYVESKYGEDNVCSVGSYSKLRIKAAMNELWLDKSKKAQVTYMTKRIKNRDGGWDEIFRSANKSTALKEFVQSNYNYVNDIRIVLGQPKNDSMHAAAVVVFPTHDGEEPMEIYDWIPVKKRDGILVSEWEGVYLEACGFLKEDLLGIRQLDKFRFITDLIEKTTGDEIDIYNIPLDDPEVYKFFCDGYTEDTFHFGSEGLKAYTKEVQPKDIHDLIDTISLHRPGTMDVGTHKEYVAVRNGAPVHYDFMMEPITKRTNGIIIYQEQVMQAVQLIGGFSLSEADTVRKAMGKKKIEVIKPYRDRFVQGAIDKGCPPEQAEELWHKLEVFSGYGFNKCMRGSTILHRVGVNKGRELGIGDMWRAKNDLDWAKDNGKLALRKKYRQHGYGKGWSLHEDGRLYKNDIVDIRYEGIRPVFRVTTESGAWIEVTENHKFPTDSGELPLSEVTIGMRIPVNKGYDNEYKYPSYARSNESNVPISGQQGFQKQFGDALAEARKRSSANNGVCQKCGATHDRIETHHINGDPSDSGEENTEYLCPSCHKKKHYASGRNRQGDSGLLTDLEPVISIEYVGDDEVYDVEMADPYHTLAVSTGVVTCNSHAAAYSITGYISMWLKVHYPVQFWTAALQFANNDDIPKFLHEINVAGDISIVPPDINMSSEDFVPDVESRKIYWSLRKISQVGNMASDEIMANRHTERGKFYSIEEFFSRVIRKKVNKKVVSSLIYAGCFDRIYSISDMRDRIKIFGEYAKCLGLPLDEVAGIPESCKADTMWWSLKQYSVSGLMHVDYAQYMKDIKFTPRFEFMEAADVEFARQGTRVCVAGVVIEDDRHKTKANPRKFSNVKLDSNGMIIQVTCWTEVWSQISGLMSEAGTKVMIVTGQVKFSDFYGINVIETFDRSKIKSELEIINFGSI